jgi:hypothetical protein
MPSRITLPPGLCICGDPACKIPYGICHCGCGKETPISTYSHRPLGYVIGMPRKVIPNHRPETSIVERFWRSVDKNGPIVRPELGPCWLWKLSVDHHGYGQIVSCKMEDNTRLYLKTHRVSWEINCGPIPEGLGVLHKCDNPPCCNPEHLFLGDTDANMKDAASKCRLPRGKKHHNGRFTPEQVLEIRRLYQGGGITQRAIGERFGVTRSAILGILRKDNYAYVDG